MQRHTFANATRLLTGAVAGLFVIGLAHPAYATMALTPAGVSQGLTLSTFATGFPNVSAVGPLGIAFVSNGGVMVTDYPGNVRIFASDVDGQIAGAAPVAQNYGATNAVGLAQIGSSIYMTQQSAGTLVQVNANGTLNQLIVSGMPTATGIVADTVTGHLFVSASGAIYNVDPIAKTKSIFVGATADGLTMSADGSILYGEVSGHIVGWNATTGAQIFDSGGIPGSPDGTAIGAGLFAGELFVNTNGGQLYEINQSTLVQTLLASGGSRGDFVTVDPNNDTLLLTQTDSVLRIAGATFVTPPPSTAPEPGPVALFGFGLLGVAALRMRWLGRKH